MHLKSQFGQNCGFGLNQALAVYVIILRVKIQFTERRSITRRDNIIQDGDNMADLPWRF
jgi:hypothetical protein